MVKNGINIELGEGFIPVKIGGLEFKLITSDKKQQEYFESLESLKQKQQEIEQKAKAFEGNEKDLDIFRQDAINTLKEMTDLILGAGAFEKLYKKAGEDSEAVIEAVIKVVYEYGKIKNKNAMQQLVDGKKR